MSSLHDELEKKLQDPNATPVFLPLEFLKAITCDFSSESELGRGGYGVVYKGVLPSGKIIAVKKLFEIHLVDDKTFQKEVSCLKEIKHQYVVQFIGYCAESSWELKELPNGRSIWAEIPKRLLCFEYVTNKSLDKYISVSVDESSALEWNMRYQIIKGICSGLNFLHEECRIVHMDLKPENILMDDAMIPKIADFGLARIFSNQQSRIVTINSAGSRGYMAPEYIDRGIISMKADIFSLGVIIIEIMTGHRDYPYFQLDSPESTATSCQHFTEEVLGNWRDKFESTVKYIPMEKYNQQVKQCIAIALKCVDPGMEKRPTVNDVIQVLNTVDQMEANKEMPSEMESKDKSLVLDTNISKELILNSITKEMFTIKTSGTVGDVKKSQECFLPTPLCESSTSSRNYQGAEKNPCEPQQASDKTEVIPCSSVLLHVHPLELRFRFKPDKLMACSLHLTNKTVEQMAFVLLKKSNEHTSFLSSLPMFGIVDPMTTYTLTVIMNKHKHLPQERNVDLTLQTIKYCGTINNIDECMQYFQIAEDSGNTVQKVNLKAVYALQGETIFESIPPLSKIISMENNQHPEFIKTMDANTAESLIITGSSRGHVHIWNYKTQKSMGFIDIPNEVAVSSVKFVAHKGWFVVGSDDGFIRVYNYKKEMEEITSFRAHDTYAFVSSLAIHPTQPYVLSARAMEIKLFDWDHGWFGWKCMQTFKEQLELFKVAFNPKDCRSFFSASWDHTVKVWSVDSPKSKYTLFGHSNGVTCLDFFGRSDGLQYLITGSYDNTAKIWDMQKKECVCTLPHRSAVMCVLSHPKLPVIVTGTEGGDIYLWSSNNFRLKRIIKIGGRKWVIGLACLNDSERVVVAHHDGLSVIEIPDPVEPLGDC
ncbi:unnamed protein product [Alopecurus aequalis]